MAGALDGFGDNRSLKTKKGENAMEKAKTFSRQTAKLLAVVGENMPDLSGEEMQYWIQRPKSLQVFLGGLSVSKKIKNSGIWKTILLDTNLKSYYHFESALLLGGVVMRKSGERLMQIALEEPSELIYAFDKKNEKIEVDLVLKTVEELGCGRLARLDDIYKQAEKLGLKLCPSEIGPHLRLNYKNQPRNEYLHIAMKPIYIDKHSKEAAVFYLGCDNDGPWLDASEGSYDCYYPGGMRLVFVLPRK